MKARYYLEDKRERKGKRSRAPGNAGYGQLINELVRRGMTRAQAVTTTRRMDLVANGLKAPDPAAMRAVLKGARIEFGLDKPPQLTAEQVEALNADPEPGPEPWKPVTLASIRAHAAKLAANGLEKESPAAAEDKKYMGPRTG